MLKLYIRSTVAIYRPILPECLLDNPKKMVMEFMITKATSGENFDYAHQLSLIVRSHTFMLQGPWHFESENVAGSKADLNGTPISFDYMVNLMDSNNLIYPDDLPYFQHFIKELVAGKSIDYHFRVITPSGEIKPLHGFGSLISAVGEKSPGYPADSQGVEIKKIEVKKNQKDIFPGSGLAPINPEEREHFTQRIVDSTPGLIYLLDIPRKKVLYINKQALKVFAPSEEHNIEKACVVFQDALHPDDAARRMAHIANLAVLEDNDVRELEIRLKAADGKWHWFKVRDKAFERDRNGAVIQTIGSAHDITDRIHAHHELERLNASLHQKNHELQSMNEELSTFAFIASHDLREPLRKIQMFSDMIVEREKERLSEMGKGYLGKMLVSIQRMNNMIDEILTFSHVMIGPMLRKKFYLGDIVETVRDDLKEIIHSRKVIIKAEQLPLVSGNPEQFIQLLKNLISNAIKFQTTENTPEIRISTAFLEGREIDHPLVSSQKRYLKLDIADNGIGFDEKYNNKIFKMFQRLHSVSEFQGTGMGLAICKKVVENHQGFIVAQSKPGQGAIFSCYFPVDE